MKIIGQIKSLIKKNENLLKVYKKIKFVKETPLKDFFNPRKLILFKIIYPYSMVDVKRLSNIYDLAKLVERNRGEGVFAECGVWRGGCAAIMGFVSKRAKSNRKIWLFDSFEGLPEPTAKDGKIAEDYAQNRVGGRLKTINKCVGPIDNVKEIFFNVLKINPDNVVIKKGWFQDTLPKARNEIGPISILRLDGDWYESTKCCLDNLYDNVVRGGYVVVDDYGHWEGCKKAIDDFFAERKIETSLIKIDYAGVYFKKP